MKNPESRRVLIMGIILATMLMLSVVSTVAGLSEQFLPAEEKNVFDKVNAERAKAEVPKLRYNARLERAARKHSKEMAQKDYFSHTSPTPGLETVGKRVTAEDYVWVYVGENIYCRVTNGTDENGNPVWGVADLAQAAVNWWLNSPPHKANMLDEDFKDTGVGVFQGGGKDTGYWTNETWIDGPGSGEKWDWVVMFTQVFATPPNVTVGGVWVPVDKFGLLAPYIALASTILVATVATTIYVKRRKKQ